MQALKLKMASLSELRAPCGGEGEGKVGGVALKGCPRESVTQQHISEILKRDAVTLKANLFVLARQTQSETQKTNLKSLSMTLSRLRLCLSRLRILCQTQQQCFNKQALVL